MEVPIVAALIGAGVAVVGLIWNSVVQNRIAARTARIALFKERLSVYEQVENHVRELGRVVLSVGSVYAGEFPAREGLSKEVRSAMLLTPRVQFLFGDDVVSYHDDLKTLFFDQINCERLIDDTKMGEAERERRIQRKEGISYGEYSDRVLDSAERRRKRWHELQSSLLSTFDPYLGQDRHVGLSFANKTSLLEVARLDDRDPALRSLAPYRPGSKS